ncbi:MAG: hypothetical protein A2511_07300 [Deltaproteobacteria bacterium RIFOXYD12_FULL_50_9]|nr:MAG: hypothetical protein A2511_07300 [Deltaproteobacteria bacterium RIFOXYD12_FULL_50_9]
MAIDPVCGMNVDERAAQHSSHHIGENYCFCSKADKSKSLILIWGMILPRMINPQDYLLHSPLWLSGLLK